MKLSIGALTVTVAILWGGAVLLCGIANLIWPSYGLAFLQFVASIYPGYPAARSLGSVVVGTGYAILDGALAGLVFGWLYNCFAGEEAARASRLRPGGPCGSGAGSSRGARSERRASG